MVLLIANLMDDTVYYLCLWIVKMSAHDINKHRTTCEYKLK